MKIRSRLNNILSSLKEEHGFGLVESLVAVAILGVGVTALISDLSVGSLAVNTQNEITIAQGLAQSQMETIKAAAYSPSGSAYIPVTAPQGYNVAVGTNQAVFNNNNIQKITVTVIHNNNSLLVIEDYKVSR